MRDHLPHPDAHDKPSHEPQKRQGTPRPRGRQWLEPATGDSNAALDDRQPDQPLTTAPVPVKRAVLHLHHKPSSSSA